VAIEEETGEEQLLTESPIRGISNNNGRTSQRSSVNIKGVQLTKEEKVLKKFKTFLLGGSKKET